MGIAKVTINTAICVLLLAGILACQEDHPIGDDCDPATRDCKKPTAQKLEKEIKNIDILFVIDKSQSMIQEQVKLAQEMPKLIKVLVTGDRDGDGKADPGLKPAESIHLGVVTSDLGLPGITNATDLPDISCQGIGDDGLLQNQGHPTIDPQVDPATIEPRCQAEYPTKFITHKTGTDNADDTAIKLRCLLPVGPFGCGFEQPLEAALKALWPSDNHDVTFLATQGHGGDQGENKGFLRKDSLLAIVVVTDEDDCSMGAHGNTDMLKKAPAGLSEEQTKNLNLRCYYDEKLPESERNKYPIKRYLDGFRALRPGMEDRVIFGVIGGVPVDLVNQGSDLPEAILGDITVNPADMVAYYGDILDAPLMQTIEDPAAPGYLASACVVDNPAYTPPATEGAASDKYITDAQPARRHVKLAQAFGVNGVVQSICEESFVTPIERLSLTLTNRMMASAAE